jgi:hypothetical protein
VAPTITPMRISSPSREARAMAAILSQAPVGSGIGTH